MCVCVCACVRACVRACVCVCNDCRFKEAHNNVINMVGTDFVKKQTGGKTKYENIKGSIKPQTFHSYDISISNYDK